MDWKAEGFIVPLLDNPFSLLMRAAELAAVADVPREAFVLCAGMWFDGALKEVMPATTTLVELESSEQRHVA